MWTVFWQSLVLATSATIILRIGGRKSISQMTIPQFAILLTIGSVIGSQVSGKGLPQSILSTATFVGFLMITEWIGLKFNLAENVLRGKSIPVIVNGKLVVENLRKLRISVDDLEKRLRIAGISKIEDVEIGTIEVNGQFGYKLTRQAQPVTIGDLEKLIQGKSLANIDNSKDIFSELTQKGVQETETELH